MKRKYVGILIKFLGVLFFVAFISAIISIYFSTKQQIEFFNKLYLNKAQVFSQTFDANLTQKDIENNDRIQEKVYKYLLINPDIEKIIISLQRNNQLIIVASNDLSLIGQTTEPEHRVVLESGKFISKTINNTLEVISPMRFSGKVIGIYEMYLSKKDSEKTIITQVTNYIIFSLIGLGLLILGTFLLFKFMIALPINKLIYTAKEVGNGNLNTKVDIKSGDEFEELAIAFNDMIGQLNILRVDLESKITERTKDLAKKIKDIEKKNKDLEDNKVAMINLLEDGRELEEQLKIEKENVEMRVKERTEELSKEKTKLLASIEAIIRAYILVDPQGKIILINHRLTSILGKPENNIWTLEGIQKKFGKTFDIINSYKKVVKEKKPIHVKEIVLDTKYLDLFINPILSKEENNEFLGILIMIGDITEEKILDRSKDEFFSIASHELRTPLTAIRGNTDLIMQFYSDKLKDPQFIEMIADIHESSVRLIDIVNDFLNVSRLEQGKLEFKPVIFDLVDLIEKSIKEYQVTGSRKKLAIELKSKKTITPKVFADPDKIRQVLINLIGNSLKFTEKGGITIDLQQDKNLIKVLVSDTGRGISPENQALLFHKFQQAGSSIYTRDTTRGTGLGLYISKLMIEGMGGRIKLESSSVDEGSTFSFTLPIAKQSQKLVLLINMAKILIVEDDPLMSRMYHKIFTFEGYQVEMAGDGQEGIEKARSSKPTIILMDIMMPKMNGLEALVKMKSDPDLKAIPVVMLTNLAGTQDAEAAILKGAVKYIIKSEHDPKQVTNIIKEILAGYTRDKVPETKT